MVFLMEYDRGRGRIVSLRPFLDADRKQAADERLSLEIDLNKRGVDREVVLLEATDEAALRQTHRRYFENLAEMAQSAAVSSAVREDR